MKMGFLIRAAFWFSLVLLLLPFGAGSGTSGDDNVGPIQALLAARDAVGDIAGMCDRRPDVCETGKQAMHTIGVRAKATAKIAAELISDENEAPDQTTVTGSVPEAEVGSAPAKN
jgi:hypothetical protein